jgi:hypothetical protein
MRRFSQTKGSLFLLKMSEVSFRLRTCSDSERFWNLTNRPFSSELSAQWLTPPSTERRSPKPYRQLIRWQQASPFDHWLWDSFSWIDGPKSFLRSRSSQTREGCIQHSDILLGFQKKLYNRAISLRKEPSFPSYFEFWLSIWYKYFCVLSNLDILTWKMLRCKWVTYSSAL